MESIALEENKSKRKRGEVRADGMVYWNKLVNGNDHWVTPERFIEKKKLCNKLANDAYHKNPAKSIAGCTQWKRNNKEKLRLQRMAASLLKPKKRKPPMSEEERKIRRKLSQQKHLASTTREEITRKKREYRHANREKQLEVARKFRGKNRLKILQRTKERRLTDPVFDMSCRLRGRIASALQKRGFPKNQITQNIVGCSWSDFCLHIESFFNEKIHWGNRSTWHLDHVIPLASAKTHDELIALCHFSNLRPLPAIENLRKNSKMPHELK